MKLRKALSLALTGALCVGLLAGCGGNPSTPSTSSTCLLYTSPSPRD